MNVIHYKNTPEIYKVIKLQVALKKKKHVPLKRYMNHTYELEKHVTLRKVHWIIHMNYKSYCNTEAYNKLE